MYVFSVCPPFWNVSSRAHLRVPSPYSRAWHLVEDALSKYLFGTHCSPELPSLRLIPKYPRGTGEVLGLQDWNWNQTQFSDSSPTALSPDSVAYWASAWGTSVLGVLCAQLAFPSRAAPAFLRLLPAHPRATRPQSSLLAPSSPRPPAGLVPERGEGCTLGPHPAPRPGVVLEASSLENVPTFTLFFLCEP